LNSAVGNYFKDDSIEAIKDSRKGHTKFGVFASTSHLLKEIDSL